MSSIAPSVAGEYTSFAPVELSQLTSLSKDARDKTLVIRKVTEDIVTFSVPFSRAGLFAIGGRSTAIRLPSSDIFIYVSHPHTSATQEALKKLRGEVKYLVTPDGEHGMYIADYVKAYPAAKPIGVLRHKTQKPNIPWAGLFGDGGENQKYGFEPDITLHQCSSHANHELMAIHHPSGTLLEADMLFNLPPKEQYSRAGGTPFGSRLFGGAMSPGGKVHSTMVSGVMKDKA
ncbi:hypothetical protein M231_03565 [Tremella mesenterica]|uniref:Metallo-beta-lactamase domain-containing protein n=2 Tax=Tremella mesenterica TaxID=5217 RepID=A0A4Q1BMY5_TREME|nr:hypothetical protein M231_03565 [Tremella mesenterica]